MKIGIPNRSSFLHTAAVVQCIRWGVIDPREYHPAKLYYETGADTVVLARANTLCGLLEDRLVDLIFTGEDYATEHLTERVQSVATPFFEVRFALLQRRAGEPVDRVYTKFARTARKMLPEWNVACSDLIEVGGASETFCHLDDHHAAFDILCTGITQRANSLHVIQSGGPLTCAWFHRGEALPAALRAVLEDPQLMENLRVHYARYLAERDDQVSAIVHGIIKDSEPQSGVQPQALIA